MTSKSLQRIAHTSKVAQKDPLIWLKAVPQQEPLYVLALLALPPQVQKPQQVVMSPKVVRLHQMITKICPATLAQTLQTQLALLVKV
jgi:hypothetical protein